MDVCDALCLTATRTYDAFGTLVASSGTPQGPFGFAATSGYQEDGDSGLKLLGHRYYDPSAGRFLTRDPIKDGRNWYAYCEANPLATVDPDGYDPQKVPPAPPQPPTPGPKPATPAPQPIPEPNNPVIASSGDISVGTVGVTIGSGFSDGGYSGNGYLGGSYGGGLLGGGESYTYTGMGSVASMSGDVSATFAYTSGSLTERYGKPYKVTDGANNTSLFEYDAGGRMSKATDPLSNATTLTYDQYDEPTSAQMPLGRTVQIGYGVAGKAPTSSSVTMGGSSQSLGQAGYDGESGLTSVTDANSLKSRATLDGQFAPSSVVNAANAVMHQFSQNVSQRKTQTIFGSGSKALTLNATMNPNGDVFTVAGSDGRTSTLVRLASDPGMVSSIRSQDANGTIHTDLGYDSFGRVTSAAKEFQYNGSAGQDLPTYTHQFTYDSEDHVLSVTQPGRSYAETSYEYNADGTRGAMLVGLNNQLSNGAAYVRYVYGYDGAKRMASVYAYYADASKAAFGSPLAWATYAYDADGRVGAVRTPKAVTLYGYDALGRLTGLQNLTPDGYADPNAPSYAQVTDPANGGTHTILSVFSGLTYDILGNLTGMGYTAMSSYGSSTPSFIQGASTWRYDPNGRLNYETWTGAFNFYSTYAIDNGDNLTALRGASVAVDSASDQLTGFSFDASGEQTTLGGGSYGPAGSMAYDASGRVTSVGGTSPYGTGGSYSMAPLYDEAGRRRAVAFGTNGSGQNGFWTDRFVYDGDALVYRTHPVASPALGQALTDMSTSDPNVLYLWGPTGPAMEFDLSGHSRAFTYDPRGDVVATADVRAASPVFFDAYGKPINSYAGDDRYRLQPLQYKGQSGYYADAYANLYYCLHRYYDWRTGRWTQRDPIGLEGGINVYAYCGGNPVMGVDPSGLQMQQFSFERAMNDYIGYHGNDELFTAQMMRAGKKAIKNAPKYGFTSSLAVDMAQFLVGVNEGDYRGMFFAVGAAGFDAFDFDVPELGELGAELKTSTSLVRYSIDLDGMAPHLTGSLRGGKSQFLYRVNAEELTLRAAKHADLHGLWKGTNKSQADVVFSEYIGVHANTGQLTKRMRLARSGVKRGQRIVHSYPVRER